MTEVAWVLILIFLALLLLNVPIAIAIGTSSLLAIVASAGMAPAETIVASRMISGVSASSLLAIPFFILSGILMGRGGMARRLIDLANALVGHYPGGLAYVNTVTSMLFGSISGSATAAVSGIGGFMLPEMRRSGYDNDFSVAVTMTSATTGLIIPPSNIMITYAVVCDSVSIAAIFIAGILPGILIGLCIMTVSFLCMRRKSCSVAEKVGLRDLLLAFKRAFLSLFLIVIIIGGIFGGIFTATEASAVAVAYAFIVSVCIYREISPREIPEVLRQTAVTTAIVMFLIAVSMSMSWIMAIADIPQTISTALLSISSNKVVILLFINILLLSVGMFMDMTPAVLIFTPIFLPIVRQFGMSPVHFGIMIIANLCIGLCTPPTGSCLFLGCSIGKTTIAKVTKPLIPFFAGMFIAVLLITFIPQISLWLPQLSGLLK